MKTIYLLEFPLAGQLSFELAQGILEPQVSFGALHSHPGHIEESRPETPLVSAVPSHEVADSGSLREITLDCRAMAARNVAVSPNPGRYAVA